MDDFKIPKNRREYEALSFEEQQLLIYLFSKRAIQVTQELQSFTFGMGLIYNSAFDREKMESIFRVLSYSPMNALFLEAKEEYERALSMAHLKIKSTKLATVVLAIIATLTFTGTVDLLKVMG